MFKILDEPQSIISTREAAKLYPNKAYLFIDIKEVIDGKVHKGFKGKLYAIADETPQDIEKYYECLKELRENELEIGLFDSFELKDTILW